MAFIFTGKYEQLLDDKNRIAIPAKWRDQFDAPAYLTSGDEKCIAVYTKGAFEAASAEVLAIAASTKEGRDGRRKFFGDARDVAKDSQNRLLVPQPLLDHAGLGKEILVIGTGEWFEVWDKAAYQAYSGGGTGE